MRKAQFFCQQIQQLRPRKKMLVGDSEVGANPLQRLHVSGPCQKDTFRHRLPAGDFEQLVAQRLYADAGLGGQHDAGAKLRIRDRVQLAPDIDHRCRRRELALETPKNFKVRGSVGVCIGTSQVVQEKYRVGAFYLTPGTRDADLFDLVVSATCNGTPWI